MAADALICPNCGTRNKAKWEYCARCGESLADIEPSSPEAYAEEPSGEDWGGDESGLPPGIVAVVGLAALALGWGVTWRYMSPKTPPTTLSPTAFAFVAPPHPPPSPPPTTVPSRAARASEEGRARLARGDAAGALQFLEEAVADEPDNPEYLAVLGRALWETGARDDALARYAQAARLAPAEYGLENARALNVAGRNAEAVAAYEAMLAGGGPALLREDVGRLLYRMGDFARAVPHLQVAVEARGGDPALRQELAYALDKAGKTAEAQDAYRAVLSQAPQADVARGLLADSLYRNGQPGQAEALLAQGLQANPSSPLLHRGLASILERSGRLEEAAKEYSEYARLAPNAPDVKALQARAATLAPPSS